MYPVLYRFGHFPVYTYSLMLTVAIVSGITVARKEAIRAGQNPETIVDMAFYVLIAAVMGSRLFYVLGNPTAYLKDPLEIVRFWHGGTVGYGGFVVGAAVVVAYVKIAGMPLWQTADIISPGLAVGQVIGKVGCFFAGCSYGRVCDMPWAVIFTDPDSLAPKGMPLHPTQLYFAFTDGVILGILWYSRKQKRFDGQIFWRYIFLYGLFHMVITPYRGDIQERILFDVFSTTQWVEFGFATIALLMLAKLGRALK